MDHKRLTTAQIRNDAMKGHAVVEPAFAKLKEIPHGVGRMIRAQGQVNITFVRVQNDITLGVDAQSAQEALRLVIG